MPINVIVTGLPGDTTFAKLVRKFKKLMKRVNMRNYWIRELSDMYGSDCKQMCVEFPSSEDAFRARDYLDNLSYTQDQAEYRLMACMEEGSLEPREDFGRRRRDKRGRASRSPSPAFHREASKLDLEIELLRKQRQVIEEERRLLLEKKKLEMIREFGPSVTREFEDFEPPRKRRHPSEAEPRPPRRRSPPPRKPKPPQVPTGIPVFFQPCKRLIAEMREHINKDTTTEERDILVKLIRAAIRKNLCIALDGKGYMPTEKILELYRQLHPKSLDDVFVGKILANIRASYLPDELEGKKAGTGKPKETEQPENSEADLNVVKEEIKLEIPKVEENSEPKEAVNQINDTNGAGLEEKPAIEENETEAGVEVKEELNVSEMNTTLELPAEETSTEPTADDAFIADSVEETALLPDNGEEAATPATEEQ